MIYNHIIPTFIIVEKLVLLHCIGKRQKQFFKFPNIGQSDMVI